MWSLRNQLIFARCGIVDQQVIFFIKDRKATVLKPKYRKAL